MNEKQVIIKAIKFAIEDAKENLKAAKRAGKFSEAATARAYLNGLEVSLQIIKAVDSSGKR